MEKTMKLKSKLLLALLATSSAAFAQTAPAAPESTLGYNVGVVSEYRYRAIGQSRGEPALQGGVDYAHSNGFYAGAWGSTIKWIKDAGATDGSTELDLYGGYKFEAAGLAYDVGFLRYEYVGNKLKNVSGFTNANTNEAYAAVTAGPATVKYSYSLSDLFGNINSKGSSYLEASATFDLGNGYTLTPHAGRQAVKNNTIYSYTDVSLTAAKDLGDGLSASVSAISTNVKSAYTNAVNGYNGGKSIVVVGVKYSF
jgi:uncharacterized protein (TIGR02001 family)